jgi:hypothetical protein
MGSCYGTCTEALIRNGVCAQHSSRRLNPEPPHSMKLGVCNQELVVPKLSSSIAVAASSRIFLEDVGVPPEGHRLTSEWPSAPFAPMFATPLG